MTDSPNPQKKSAPQKPPADIQITYDTSSDRPGRDVPSRPGVPANVDAHTYATNLQKAIAQLDTTLNTANVIETGFHVEETRNGPYWMSHRESAFTDRDPSMPGGKRVIAGAASEMERVILRDLIAKEEGALKVTIAGQSYDVSITPAHIQKLTEVLTKAAEYVKNNADPSKVGHEVYADDITKHVTDMVREYVNNPDPTPPTKGGVPKGVPKGR